MKPQSHELTYETLAKSIIIMPSLILLFLSFVSANPSVGVALRQSNCATAVELLPNPEKWNYQLAIGRCYTTLGRLDQADATLSKVTGEWEPYALMYRAEAASLSNDSTQAMAHSEKVLNNPKSSDSLKEQAALIKARAAITDGQYLEARNLLRPLLTPKRSKDGYVSSPFEIDPAEVRWLLAEGARLRGAEQSSIPVYWRIWISNPTSTYASLAEERLTTLGERVPNSTTDSGRKQIVRRANTLRGLQLHKEALSLLDILPVPETELEKKTYAYYVFSAKDYPRSVEFLNSLTAPTDKELYHLAVASVRAGDYDACLVYYRDLLSKYPKSKWADISSYKLGYSEYDRGNWEIAIPLFKQHLERKPKSKYADDTRYFIAWSLFKLGKFDEAKKAFAEFQVKHFKSSLTPGAAFWHAFILNQQGLTDEAEKGFQYILKTWPTSGYAWQTTHFIDVSFPIQEPIDLDALVLPDILDTETFHTGRSLAEVGFESLAQQKLRSLKDSVKGNKQATLILAHALIESGAYREAQKISQPYCVKPWTKGNPLAMQACYPKPHRTLIDSVIDDHDLDPNLPYAIMTAESALQPTVSSPAGARGMMQLMPFVAESLHPSVFPNQPFNADDLFQSGYNVSLGTKELINLYDHLSPLGLEHPLPLVISGYNGGEDAVRRWMSLYDAPPEIAEYSDDIGYTETRRYNRRVLGYLMTYRYVYGWQEPVDETKESQ